MVSPTPDDKLMLRLILAGESLFEVSRIMHVNPRAVLRRLKALVGHVTSDEDSDHSDGSGTRPS